MLAQIISNETGSMVVPLPNGNQAVIRCMIEEEQHVLRLELPYSGVYGMGEKYNSLNQKGLTSINQVSEKFCYQGEHTYCAAPFFVTDTGMGIYVQTDETTIFEFKEEIYCQIPGDAAVYVFTGPISEIIADYTKLFGPVKLPPKYAFGVWISANHWNSQDKVMEQLKLLKRHDFPASVMVLEAWSDEATFYIWNDAECQPKPEVVMNYEDFNFSSSSYWPDPAQMIDELHREDIRLVLWQIPVYKTQGPDEVQCYQLDLDRHEAIVRRLCVMTDDGAPYQIPAGNWFAGSIIPDFTNKETRDSWFGKRRYLLDMGIDGFKTDGGEFIYREDVCLNNGMNGKQAKNAYAQQYIKAYSDVLNDEQILFSRAGFAGAHTTPIHWGGDQQSTNEELANVLKAGLSAAMTGISFWGFDIAGFAGALPTLDLYRRATQLACFCPVMQWHSEPDGGQFSQLMPGGDGNNERSPWNLAAAYGQPEFIDEMRYWHKFRMDMLPYLYSTAIKSAEYYQPMMRPLVYDWPQDADAVKTEDEFMLGESLLIAPLLGKNQKTRTVYFPAGEWFGLFSGRRYEGVTYLPSDEERFPVYLKSGTAFVVNQTSHLHFILGGRNGKDVFRDEEHQLDIVWREGNVDIVNGDGLSITWEVIGK